MNGLFDGMLSNIAAMGCLVLLLIFFVLKLSGVLLLSYWWALLPASLFVGFIVLSTQPGAP